MDTTKELLTLGECEALTKRKIATWRKDIYLRRVPVVRLGRQVRVPKDFVLRLIEKGLRLPVEGE